MKKYLTLFLMLFVQLSFGQVNGIKISQYAGQKTTKDSDLVLGDVDSVHNLKTRTFRMWVIKNYIDTIFQTIYVPWQDTNTYIATLKYVQMHGGSAISDSGIARGWGIKTTQAKPRVISVDTTVGNLNGARPATQYWVTHDTLNSSNFIVGNPYMKSYIVRNGAINDTVGGNGAKPEIITRKVLRTDTTQATNYLVGNNYFKSYVSGSSKYGTISNYVLRDANGNTHANNFESSIFSTVTATGTTTLTVGSTRTQIFTGSTTQTLQLPDTRTLTKSHAFEINNNSSGAVTINKNGGGNLTTMAANTYVILLPTDTTTAAGTWDYHWLMPSASLGTIVNNSTGILSVAHGGTGFSSFTAHGVIIGEGGTTFAVTAAGTTGQVLMGATGADPTWQGVQEASTFTATVGSTTFTTTTVHMCGLTTSITPNTTGVIEFSINWTWAQASAGSGGKAQIYYGVVGTATQPSNGGTVPSGSVAVGTPINQSSLVTTGATQYLAVIVSGFSPGTAVWVDLGVGNNNSTGQVTVSNVQVNEKEIK